MPFNASGTYTLSDEIANSTPADATEVQGIFDDLEAGLNATFLRDGSAIATGQFLGIVGATPQYSFSGDANTGFGSATGDEVYMMGGGVQTWKVNATGGTLTGTLAVSGNVAINTNKFTVTASNGNTLIAGTLTLTSDFAINTNKFTVAASSGNTAIAGTCVVTGALTASNGFTVSAGSISLPAGSVSEAALAHVAFSQQKFDTVASSQTYTTPAGCRAIRIRMVAGGGGGGGATGNNGNTGGTTSFDAWTAIGGAGGPGNTAAGALGGTGGSGTALRIQGGDGIGCAGGVGGMGGSSHFGGAGKGASGAAGTVGKANSGGGGGPGNSGGSGGSGGGAGEYVEFTITNPAATYTYTVGDGGGGGAAGGQAGAKGGSGLIMVDEYY